jgi:hypothetical protein
MATQIYPRASFEKWRQIESIFTGGQVAVADCKPWLFTPFGEELHVTDIISGSKVHRLSGVSFFIYVFMLIIVYNLLFYLLLNNK